MLGAITIGIPPEFDLLGLTVTWHGLMTAVGIAVGGALASRAAREEGLDPDTIVTMVVVIAVAGIAGSRALYLVINEPGDLLRPDRWIGNRGFAFYGAMIAGPLAAALWLRRTRHSPRYLDMAAVGFALGTAVGRVGDLISGEHHGPPSDVAWAVRYTDPGAEVPMTGVAYQSGALYEIVLGLAIFAIVWPLRHRLRTPTILLWLVIGLYGAGRFAMFFARSDSAEVAIGINEAQLLSLGLVLVALAGAALARRRAGAGG